MSSRVTRSSSKKSAHSFSAHQNAAGNALPDPDPPPPPTALPRKRKSSRPSTASSADTTADDSIALQSPLNARPTKRAKIAKSNISPSSDHPPIDTSNATRRKRSSRTTNMSTPDTPVSPADDGSQAHTPTSSSASKKKSGKSSRKASSSSTKSHNRISALSSSSSKTPKTPDAPAEPTSPSSPRDEDDEDDAEDEAMADPFGGAMAGFLGRRGLGSAYADLRVMSSLLTGSSSSSSRFQSLLSDLQNKEDPTAQFAALSQLSELLLMSSEDGLASGRFNPQAFVPPLVELMQPSEFGENPDMMLLACRCIANMIEALPASMSSIVQSSAVPVLISKLQAIEYMDVAEQALETLEKISQEFPHPIVNAGGLTACLSYLDFFATSTQRTAVSIAANCSRAVPDDHFEDAKEVMPILLNVLNNSDQKVMEQGCICISRLIEGFKYSSEKLEQLVSPELLKAILRLLLPGSTNLVGPNIHTQFLRVLSITAASSRKLTIHLLKMDVVDTLYQILTGVSAPSGVEGVAQKIDSVVIMQALIHRPKEHVFETLNVICELLPPLDRDNMGYLHELTEALGMMTSLPLGKNPNYGGDEDEAAAANKPSLIDACSDELRRFAVVLMPTLTDAYASTVNLSVRQRVLSAQLKMLSNLSTDILESALKPIPYASFLAAILSQQDHPFLVTAALQAATLLMRRLESVYRYQFYREGVIAEIKKLSERSVRNAEATNTEKVPQLQSDQALSSSKAEEGSASRRRRGNLEFEAGDDLSDGEDDDLRDEDDMDEDDEDSDDSEVQAPVNVPGTEIARDMVTGFAKQFVKQFETIAGKEARMKATSALEGLQDLVLNIQDCYDNRSGQDGKELFTRLAQYFEGDALESITSYELLTSKVIDTLLDVFQVGESPESSAKAAFVEAFLGSSLQRHIKTTNSNASPTPFNVLVQKLQDLLSRSEHFEVTTVYHNAFENNRTSAASMLAKQLRITLVADADSTSILRAFRSVKVQIHAIATFSALNDYLLPRLAAAERVPFPTASASLQTRPSAPLPVSRGTDSSSRPASAHKSATPSLLSESQPSPTDQKPKLERSSRRPKSQRGPESTESGGVPVEDTKGAGEALECADEERVGHGDEDSEEADVDMNEAMEQIVNELEEEAREQQSEAEPSAVNVEVASTGKVTARDDNGERIPTPSHTPTPARQAGVPRPGPGGLRSLLPSSNPRPMSYASAAKTPPSWHLEFSINGRPISHDTTIYSAVHSQDTRDPSLPNFRYLWSNEHVIQFRRAEGAVPASSESSVASPESENEPETTVLPLSLEKNPATASILRLLRMLHEINANLDDIVSDNRLLTQIVPEPVAQFVNTKLTAKLNRQLEEPLIVASNCLPGWSEDLARLYPFLFPFETRHLFLQSTSFGYSRSMSRWQNAQSASDSRRGVHDRPYLGRLQRQKVRIQRAKMFESAMKVMDMYGHKPAVLEIEYFDEVGTGLGPTLEFYSSVSREFAKKKLKLWREDESGREGEYVQAKHGLFPLPMSDQQAASANGQRILGFFKTLGTFVARSMLDSRIIDLTFNPIFFRIDGGEKAVKPSLGAVKLVDEGLAHSLQTLRQFAVSKKKIDENPRLTGQQKARKIAGIQVGGATIEELGLDFTLPGHSGVELIADGANVDVTIENVGRYVELVTEFTLSRGVMRQIEAFRTGFSRVFPFSALRAFTPDELVMLFGRSEEDWSLETLLDSIKADHGYNMDSASVRHLLQIMSELGPTERREFLQFVTGSPKLPIGGFRALTPMLTVVLRPAEAGSVADATLPSVMTCQNYVKLPDYSGVETMRARLTLAIKEGAGAFHLS